MAKTVAMQVQNAHHFFRPSRPAINALMASGGVTDNKGADNVPQMFQTNANTTGSVMQFNGALPDSVTGPARDAFAALLKDQQFYLQSGMGLVTAWMTDNYQRDPTQWANPQNWQEPLSYLPAEFYTPTDITAYHFQQHMKGIEVATSFLSTMVGWASGAGIVESFSQFLGTLGDQIRAGISSKNTSMDTYHLSFGYQPIQDSAGNWQLVSLAEYYFISFTESEQTVYSSCASAETFDFDFKYQKGRLLLNWASLDNGVNKQARSDWDGSIASSTVDDVQKAKNFFGKKSGSEITRSENVFGEIVMTTLPNAQPAVVSLYLELAPSPSGRAAPEAREILRGYLGVLAHYLADQPAGTFGAQQQAFGYLPALLLATATHLDQSVQTSAVNQSALQGLLTTVLDSTLPPGSHARMAEVLASALLHGHSGYDAPLPRLQLSIACNDGVAATAQLCALDCEFSAESLPETNLPVHQPNRVQLSVSADWTAYTLRNDQLAEAQAFLASMKNKGGIEEITLSSSFMQFSSE